jgi:hypothetical protein
VCVCVCKAGVHLFESIAVPTYEEGLRGQPAIIFLLDVGICFKMK